MPTSSSSSFSVEPPPVTNGLILWLTAEANVTKDAASHVSEWRDSLSGFLSAQAGAKPLWVADAFPGHPGIRFSGGQSLFIMTSDMGQNNFTIIILGRATAPRLTGGDTHAGQRFLICQNFTEGFPAISVGSNGFGIYEFGASPALRAEAVTDASVLCPLTIRYVNRAPAGYLNGNLVTQGTPTTGILCSIPHSIGGDGGTGSFVGDIAEILIYNGSFTEQDRLVVETWLQVKYDCFGGSSSSSDSSQSSESSDGGGGSSGSSESSDSSSSESSESSESSDSSSSESSGSSDSSGGGGGGSSESGSSDSSSSESSDSSESSESSERSSSSNHSSSSNDGPSLYFDEDPVYVDWNETSYDANENLVTNHSPISWSISAEATINDYGVVTFGNIGEEATVTASGSPYDSMTLWIVKAELQEVEFTSAHSGSSKTGLLTDYDTDYAGHNGLLLGFRGWIASDPTAPNNPGKNNPITHTMGSHVTVTVKTKVEPAGLEFVLTGTSSVTGLTFTSVKQTATGNSQYIDVTSNATLENKIQIISGASIEWKVKVQDTSIRGGTSGPHTVFVTWGKPKLEIEVDQPPEPGGVQPTQNFNNTATIKRIKWVTEKAAGATTEKDIVDKLHEALAAAKNPGGSTQTSWAILDGQTKGDCDDHARLFILCCGLEGISVSAKYIFASKDNDCITPEIKDLPLPDGGKIRSWLFLVPAGATGPAEYDNYQGVALYSGTYYSVSPNFKVSSSVDALRKLHEENFAEFQKWMSLHPPTMIPWKNPGSGAYGEGDRQPFPWAP